MLFGVDSACGVIRVCDQKHSQVFASVAQVLLSCPLQLLVNASSEAERYTGTGTPSFLHCIAAGIGTVSNNSPLTL